MISVPIHKVRTYTLVRYCWFSYKKPISEVCSNPYNIRRDLDYLFSRQSIGVTSSVSGTLDILDSLSQSNKTSEILSHQKRYGGKRLYLVPFRLEYGGTSAWAMRIGDCAMASEGSFIGSDAYICLRHYAVHEIGHTLSLSHCESIPCVMGSLLDIESFYDWDNLVFCQVCHNKLYNAGFIE